jgi:hypothetical protein
MIIRECREVFYAATERQCLFFRVNPPLTLAQCRAHNRLFRATVRAQIRLYRAIERAER